MGASSIVRIFVITRASYNAEISAVLLLDVSAPAKKQLEESLMTGPNISSWYVLFLIMQAAQPALLFGFRTADDELSREDPSIQAA